MAAARRGRADGANGVVRPRPRDRVVGVSGSMAGRVAVLAFCVAGIWSAYIYQGVLQETLLLGLSSDPRSGSGRRRGGSRLRAPCVPQLRAECRMLRLVLPND
uniref:Uncharacterized protein n=1 Tax=Zea mays TaxID=4577 RepID=C0HHN6_MAIZE|nr:unknown [Zea mays]